MKVALVATHRCPRSALGEQIRWRGMLSGARAGGHQVELITLPHSRHVPELLTHALPPAATPVRQLFDVAQQADLVYVQGLPLGLAINALTRRPMRTHLHVDICDSWMQLVPLSSRPGATHGQLLAGVKKAATANALRYTSARADSVSYISLEDKRSDSPWLSKATPAWVIPNSSDLANARESELADPDGPFVVVGDWGYGPNVDMLDRTIAWLSADDTLSSVGLRVVGPNLPQRPLPDGVRYLGWVDDIKDAYRGTRSALALVESGAGVKNKVLEPLALGIPLVASAAALNGIDRDTEMVRELAEESASEIALWSAMQRSRETNPRMPSWADRFDLLMSNIGGVSS